MIRHDMSVNEFIEEYFRQCRELFSFLIEKHGMILEDQGRYGYELSTKFVGSGRSVLMYHDLPVPGNPKHPGVGLEKTIKPRGSISLNRLCERFSQIILFSSRYVSRHNMITTYQFYRNTHHFLNRIMTKHLTYNG